MAYMDQIKKAKIAAALKKVMPAGWKYTLSVHNHSSITMTIKSAPFPLIDMINAKNKASAEFRGDVHYEIKGGNCQLNMYYLEDAFSEPAVLEVLINAKKALYSADYYDDSDVQTDYFNCAYYAHMQVGTYDKPFVMI
jgi:hypothetical protein